MSIELGICSKENNYSESLFRMILREVYSIFIPMIDLSHAEGHVQCVSNFQDLVSTPFQGKVNAIGWTRKLVGDFSEIVEKVEQNGNLTIVDEEELLELQLSEQGQLARSILIQDFRLLEQHGADPTLNLIKYYERDDSYPFFPTDVYSFHVDRSPIPTDTFLCTYYGAPSDIIPNALAERKVLIPEIRNELKKLYDGEEKDFEAFLSENFFDLHYQTKPEAKPVCLGNGHLWRLAIDHPELKVPPCIHRAPIEKNGQTRLLLIC